MHVHIVMISKAAAGALDFLKDLFLGVLKRHCVA